MSRQFEQTYPVLFSALLTAVWFFFGWPFPEESREFLAASISVGAIITGFLATCQSILLALPSGSIVNQFRESGYIRDLTQYLSEAFYGSLLFSAGCLAMFFVPKAILSETQVAMWASTAWLFLAVHTALSLVRISRTMMRILHAPVAPSR